MEHKIDRRRHYIIIIDTETANTIEENGRLNMDYVLAYDCGWVVADTKGNVYEKRSFVNRDIFINERDLMKSAYYADKIPSYIQHLKEGKRKMASTYEIKNALYHDIKDYGIHEICAHNARFDAKALDNTQRWTTKSKYRYFLPRDVEWWDSLKMARSVIGKMPTYKQFCRDNGYITKNNQLRFTAEILYRFISGENEFDEEHTALEDVMIEKEIVAYCFRQHKAMKKKLYND